MAVTSTRASASQKLIQSRIRIGSKNKNLAGGLFKRLHDKNLRRQTFSRKFHSAKDMDRSTHLDVILRRSITQAFSQNVLNSPIISNISNIQQDCEVVPQQQWDELFEKAFVALDDSSDESFEWN
jgi:hypothetical protein